MSSIGKSAIYFSKFIVNDQVFYKTKYTYALVNLKPIVPGHVLIVPLRVVQRLKDLTDEESIDYMRTVQKIHRFIEYHYQADSLNIAIQDGPEAGQSIPHLHAHVIPRHKENNMGDKIYDLIEGIDLEHDLKDFYIRKQMKKEAADVVVKPDSERFPRSMDEMRKEAQELRESLIAYGTTES